MSVDYRAQIVKLMKATIADEAAQHDWTYREIRPIGMPPSPWHAGQQITGDCSKGAQFLWWWVGGPDPMGNNYASWGNSSTICSHLQHLYEPKQMLPGDICTVGWNGDLHACVCLLPGADPIVWSFGHQGTPEQYPLSKDTRWPKQYLRVPVPVYNPTPEDELRAMTGYWAWVQWRLGEGSWRHYAPADPKVRPDVPRLIPARWWLMLAKFLAARKQGNKATT